MIFLNVYQRQSSHKGHHHCVSSCIVFFFLQLLPFSFSFSLTLGMHWTHVTWMIINYTVLDCLKWLHEYNFFDCVFWSTTNIINNLKWHMLWESLLWVINSCLGNQSVFAIIKSNRRNLKRAQWTIVVNKEVHVLLCWHSYSHTHLRKGFSFIQSLIYIKCMYDADIHHVCKGVRSINTHRLCLSYSIHTQNLRKGNQTIVYLNLFFPHNICVIV